ncbi:transporter suffix domain-containing protein [Pseudomonas frederiksbergensis]|uniref:transporter suffix domain-containing protein n=1 Tax=Pseudomonas frederiksbergensis TaxID=104087 RepID=UPI0032E397E9
MTSPQDEIAPSSTGWRFKAGIGILSLTVLAWLLVPLAAAADVPGPKIAALTGILFISNKILLILAIAVMGKSGFQQLKRSVFGYVSTLAPTEQEVGPARHRVGLVMFCLPLISSFLEPYVDTLWPGLRPNLWQVQALGDAMLVGSFFVLGGNFWDKVRALFIRTARVVNTSTV